MAEGATKVRASSRCFGPRVPGLRWFIAAAALFAACGGERAVPAIEGPPAEAYFEELDDFEAHRVYPIYPFRNGVVPWLQPLLLTDLGDGACYDGLTPPAGLDSAKLCVASTHAGRLLSAAPPVAGKRVATLLSGATGLGPALALSVQESGHVSVFDPSYMHLGVLESAMRRLPPEVQGRVAGQVLDVDSPNLPEGRFDLLFVVDAPVLKIAAQSPTLDRLVAAAVASLSPTGAIVVFQPLHQDDGHWSADSFVAIGGPEVQDERFAALRYAHRLLLPHIGFRVSIYSNSAELPESVELAAGLPGASTFCTEQSGDAFDGELRKSVEAWRLAYFRPAANEDILELLGNLDGKVVVEIGAGAGDFTLELLEEVGARGRVVATDVDPMWSTVLQQRVAEWAPERYDRLQVHLNRIDNLGLARESADCAVALQVPGVLVGDRARDDGASVRRFASTVFDALRPGGTMTVVVRRDEQVEEFAERGVEDFLSVGFELTAHGALPFSPPHSVVGIAVWSTCFGETADNLFVQFRKPQGTGHSSGALSR